MDKKTIEIAASLEIPDKKLSWAETKIHDWQLKSAGRAVQRISDNPEDMARLAVTFPESLVSTTVHKAILEILERIMEELEELKEKFRKKAKVLKKANVRIKKLKSEKVVLEAELDSERALSAYLLKELGLTPEELKDELNGIKIEAMSEKIEAEAKLKEKLEKLHGVQSVLQAATTK